MYDEQFFDYLLRELKPEIHKPVVALICSYNTHYFELVSLYCVIICKKTFFNHLNEIDFGIIDELDKICDKLFNLTCSVYPQSVRPYMS